MARRKSPTAKAKSSTTKLKSPTREDLLESRLKILDQLRADLIRDVEGITGYDRFADGSFGRYGKSGF